MSNYLKVTFLVAAAIFPTLLYGQAGLGFQDAVPISLWGDTIVQNRGFLVKAFNLGENRDRSVNGVLFSGLSNRDDLISAFSDPNIFQDGVISQEFESIMDSFCFTTNPRPNSIVLDGLTPGQNYLLQIFVSDDRNSRFSERKISFKLQDYISEHNLSGLSYSLECLFLAEKTFEELIITADSDSSNVSAFQVRQIELPTITPPTEFSAIRSPQDDSVLSIFLDWEKVDYAANYTVQRSRDRNSWTTIGKVKAGKEYFLDNSNSLLPGINYFYRVKANNSDWSKPLEIRSAELFNVKAPPYKAKGNQITDDYAAIQKAFDDAREASDGSLHSSIVYFPAGNYRVNNPGLARGTVWRFGDKGWELKGQIKDGAVFDQELRCIDGDPFDKLGKPIPGQEGQYWFQLKTGEMFQFRSSNWELIGHVNDPENLPGFIRDMANQEVEPGIGFRSSTSGLFAKQKHDTISLAASDQNLGYNKDLPNNFNARADPDIEKDNLETGWEIGSFWVHKRGEPGNYSVFRVWKLKNVSTDDSPDWVDISSFVPIPGDYFFFAEEGAPNNITDIEYRKNGSKINVSDILNVEADRWGFIKTPSSAAANQAKIGDYYLHIFHNDPDTPLRATFKFNTSHAGITFRGESRQNATIHHYTWGGFEGSDYTFQNNKIIDSNIPLTLTYSRDQKIPNIRVGRGSLFGFFPDSGDLDNVAIQSLTIDGRSTPVNNGDEWWLFTHALDQWDINNKAIRADLDPVYLLIENCEIRNFRGELIYRGGLNYSTLTVRNSLIHSCNSSAISWGGSHYIYDSEIYDFGNGIESFVHRSNLYRAQDPNPEIIIKNTNFEGNRNLPFKSGKHCLVPLTGPDVTTLIEDCTFTMGAKASQPRFLLQDRFSSNLTFRRCIFYDAFATQGNFADYGVQAPEGNPRGNHTFEDCIINFTDNTSTNNGKIVTWFAFAIFDRQNIFKNNVVNIGEDVTKPVVFVDNVRQSDYRGETGTFIFENNFLPENVTLYRLNDENGTKGRHTAITVSGNRTGTFTGIRGSAAYPFLTANLKPNGEVEGSKSAVMLNGQNRQKFVVTQPEDWAEGDFTEFVHYGEVDETYTLSLRDGNYPLFQSDGIVAKIENGQWVYDRIFQAARIVSTPRIVQGETGSNLELTVEFVGDEPLAFRWFKDDEPIDGANKATFIIENGQPENNGLYAIEVSNGLRTDFSQKFQVRIGGPDTSIGWNRAGTVSEQGDSIVSNEGELIEAVNLGSNADVTINGVTFKGSRFRDDLSREFQSDEVYKDGKVNDGFQTMLDSFSWVFALGEAQVISLSGLIPGKIYQVQLFRSDDRAGQENKFQYYSIQESKSKSFEHSHSYSLIGVFQAENDTESLVIYPQGRVSASLNGFQIRQLD